MSSMNANSPVFTATVVTVCLDPALADQALRIIGEMPWLLSTVPLNAYVSEERRPYISPQSRNSNTVIILIDFDANREQALESTRYLLNVFGGRATVIALSTSRDPELLLDAMRAGCKEFLMKPLQAPALLVTVSRLQADWLAASHRAAPVGTLLAFMGAKGGVGATTLAVHTAVFLAKCHNKRTLLIDTHTELGHVAIYLGLDGSRFHFQDVVKNVRRLDSALLHASVAVHASGLHVLSSPDSYGGMDGMDPDAVKRTLEFLQSEYEFIVMDCSGDLDDINVAVMHASTKVYLVATPELGAVRDLSRYVDTLTQDARLENKIEVIVNRISSRFAVNTEQIEKAVKLPVQIRFSNSYTELVRSINLGEPVDPKDKSEFSVELLRWIESFAGAATPSPTSTPAQRRSLGLFRKRFATST